MGLLDLLGQRRIKVIPQLLLQHDGPDYVLIHPFVGQLPLLHPLVYLRAGDLDVQISGSLSHQLSLYDILGHHAGQLVYLHGLHVLGVGVDHVYVVAHVEPGIVHLDHHLAPGLDPVLVVSMGHPADDAGQEDDGSDYDDAADLHLPFPL